MVIACFFKELFEVVHRQSCLAPAVACGLCGMLHVGAAYLLVDAATIVNCGLLAVLFAPFLADIGILDCGAGRHLPVAARLRSNSCLLGLGGGHGTSFFSNALGGTD
jgi:hypothetical protein